MGSNRIASWLLAIFVSQLLVEDVVVGLIISGALIAMVEFATWMTERKARYVDYHNRRDCIVIAESWPSEDGEGPELEDRYEGLYEYAETGEVQSRVEEWVRLLEEAENESRLPDLEPDLVLPVVAIYSRVGSHRMESREEYGRRIERTIREANTRYHQALELENGGRNYLIDYVLKR